MHQICMCVKYIGMCMRLCVTTRHHRMWNRSTCSLPGRIASASWSNRGGTCMMTPLHTIHHTARERQLQSACLLMRTSLSSHFAATLAPSRGRSLVFQKYFHQLMSRYFLSVFKCDFAARMKVKSDHGPPLVKACLAIHRAVAAHAPSLNTSA